MPGGALRVPFAKPGSAGNETSGCCRPMAAISSVGTTLTGTKIGVDDSSCSMVLTLSTSAESRLKVIGMFCSEVASSLRLRIWSAISATFSSDFDFSMFNAATSMAFS
ncbi:hypothetical protein D9M71_641090 [compost metagenome]